MLIEVAQNDTHILLAQLSQRLCNIIDKTLRLNYLQLHRVQIGYHVIVRQGIPGLILIHGAHSCPIELPQECKARSIEGILRGNNAKEVWKRIFGEHGMCICIAELCQVPVLAGLGYGICDVRTGCAKEHHLVGPRVHHIEEGLYAHGSIALEIQIKKENKSYIFLYYSKAPPLPVYHSTTCAACSWSESVDAR